MQAFSYSVRWVVSATLLALMFLLPTKLSAQVSDDPEHIELLIAGLDSKKYFDRESATNQLVAMGSSSLKPIALEYFDANPEMAWRIKRILRRMATEAPEELTSLQAIGVLLVLDEKWDGELSGLLAKWRENRSKRAISHLVSQGALTTPSGIQRQMFFSGFGQLNLGGSVSGNRNPLRDTANQPLPEKQAKADIDELVNGDFESVQDFVFSRLPRGAASEQLVQQQPQIVIDGRPFVFNRNNVQQNWTFIEIGSDFKGSEQDLKRLGEIHTLAAVRFVDQELTPEIQKLIEELDGLQHLGLVSSELSGSKSVTSIELPSSVNSIELGNVNIDKKVTTWLASVPLSTLILNRCQIDNNSADRFEDLEQLVSLDLRHMKVSRQMFRSLAETSSMKRLNLSVCKFKGEDFRAFARVRPRVAVFNPVSFLGVQARPTIGGAENWTCEIEMVVQGSAADEAGILAGDIIEAVNNDPVVTFQDLRMYISQHEVGEEMNLDVDRNGKKLQLTAVLGSIEER